MLEKTKKHLKDVEESYWEHMGFALHIAGVMMGGAMFAFLHALIPAVFQCSASERVFRLADEMRARKDKQHCK